MHLDTFYLAILVVFYGSVAFCPLHKFPPHTSLLTKFKSDSIRYMVLKRWINVRPLSFSRRIASTIHQRSSSYELVMAMLMIDVMMLDRLWLVEAAFQCPRYIPDGEYEVCS